MAFDKKQLLLVEDKLDYSEWTYDTADSLATVIAAGYITSGESSCFGLKVGDLVKVRIFADITTKASCTYADYHRVTAVGTSSTALSGGGVVVTAASGTLGFGTGAGGTVTQATNKGTGVTLSKPTGQITLNNAALASDTTVSFTLTNTLIEATDILVMNHVSGGTAGAYLLNAQCGAGSASVNVRNITAGSLGEAIVIGYVLIKGASA